LLRLVLLLLTCSIPATSIDPELARLINALQRAECSVSPDPVARDGTLADLRRAAALNGLLPDGRLVAIDHDWYTPDQVLNRVDGWLPLIACVAREANIPPALLAGTLAAEIDLDYHLADAVFDSIVRSPFGEIAAHVEIGVGYAGIHWSGLRRALPRLGPRLLTSRFLKVYRHLIRSRSDAGLTRLATRYIVLDIANAAVMVRAYAELRLPGHHLTATTPLTTTDMAMIWTAYRGGVTGTPMDIRSDHRWSLIRFQRESNVAVMGDSLIAQPYYAYYAERFASVAVPRISNCC
jgi:hypothetical protein